MNPMQTSKTITMSLPEYQNELEVFKASGFCAGIGHATQFIQANKKPSEFYGPKSLDARMPNHNMMIQLLKALGHEEDLKLCLIPIEEASVNPEAPVAPAPTEAAPAEAPATEFAEEAPCESGNCSA